MLLFFFSSWEAENISGSHRLRISSSLSLLLLVLVVYLWFIWSLSQGAFRYLLTPNPDHILPRSVVGVIYAEAHSPRARLLRGWRANGFCGRSTATAFRDKSSADLAGAEEDLHSQMKRISAQKHTRSGGGRGMNGLWFGPGFYTHTLDGSNDVQ